MRLQVDNNGDTRIYKLSQIAVEAMKMCQNASSTY